MVIMSFGKHSGKSVATVYSTDKSYLEWCLKQPNIVQKYPQIISAIAICKNNSLNPVCNKVQESLKPERYNGNRDYG